MGEHDMPDTNAAATTKPQLPVAVIAIHGVGNQERGQTARALAELLQRGDTTENVPGGGYSAFEEHGMVLPVAPIKDELGLDAPPAARRTAWLTSQSEFMKTGQMRIPSEDRGEPSVDVAFTRSCVAMYDAAKHTQSYETQVLKGHRREAGKLDQPVHIFEMYWADLSRLGTAWIAILGELYQLLLHAGSVARITAELQAKSAQARKVRNPLLFLLRVFQWFVTSGIWLCTVPLVAANFVLAAVAIMILPLIITGFESSSFFIPAMLLLAGVLTWVLHYALRVYNARRPGVYKWGVGAYALAIATALFCAASGGDFRTIILRAVEMVFTLFWPMTLLIVVCIAFSIVVGIGAFVAQRQAGARARSITQGVLTSLVAMLVPLALSCAVTVALWGSASTLFKRALNANATYTSLMPDVIFDVLPTFLEPSRWPASFDLKGDIPSQTKFVDFLLSHGGSQAFDWIVLGLGIALFLLVCGTANSIFHELNPPDPAKAQRNWRLKLGGWWLNIGLRPVAFAAFLVLVLLGSLALYLPATSFCAKGGGPFWCTNDLVRNAGVLLTASSASLLVLAKAYGRGLAALRPGLDLALDVDNWLRERPRFSNPRAKILSRYLALFKHLYAAGYREVVIVAHSQGTVITADFLRFLKHFGWKSGVSIRLFTVGSPLRQLYAERFPDLYGWVTDHGGPEAKKLYGVEFWLNGYRTGDYVGRALWEDLLFRPAFRYGPHPRDLLRQALQRRENHADFSLGAGAHTHYFDENAPLSGVALDALISMRHAATAVVRPLVRPA
jgi:hypothetical protein